MTLGLKLLKQCHKVIHAWLQEAFLIGIVHVHVYNFCDELAFQDLHSP